jgi:hypothetical protein
MWNLPVFVAGGCFRAPALCPLEISELMKRATLFRLEHPRAFISKAPHANPKLAEIEKEKIDAYYGYLVPLRRTSDIKGIRPEDALNGPGLTRLSATVDELLLHGSANSAESRIENLECL